MRVLLINPNMSADVTAQLHRRTRAVLDSLPGGEALQLSSTTASFGARYIASEVSYAIAGHATLDAWARHLAASAPATPRDPHDPPVPPEQPHASPDDRPDAVLVGCFGDPGVDALRELSGRPVIGLAEAAMREAAACGTYAIVTGGRAWTPMLRRLARGLELDGRLRAIEAVPLSGPQLAADPDAGAAALLSACERARASAGPAGLDAIVIGGAALGGFAAALQSRLDCRLIDSVEAGARAVYALMREGPSAEEGAAGGMPATASASPATAIWQGLSAPLHRWLPVSGADTASD